MARTRSVLLGAGLVALLAALLVGCGQSPAQRAARGGTDGQHTTGQPTTGSTTGQPTESADQSWLIRLDTYSGEDGETRQAHYVVFRPVSGDVTAIRLPKVKVPQMSGDERALLVDAGRDWVLADSRPAPADRARGLVRMFKVAGGREQTVDVRRASGDRSLTADWAAFDARDPGLLRVVSGLTVWTIQTNDPSPRAQREGVLPQRPGWIYGGGFNKNTGTPYIEDIDSFRTEPPGNGDLDRRPIRRSGGRLLITDIGRYHGLPDPKCDLSTGFAEASGAVTIFCFDRHTITEKTLAAGSSVWVTRASARSPEIPAQGDPMFVWPKVAA